MTPAFVYRTLLWVCVVFACLPTISTPARATEANPFQNGWTLNVANSEFRFISVKKGNIAESHNFTQLSGRIQEDGEAVLSIVLNSVETYVDIRNVRMRFLFFETFRYPNARVNLRIDRGDLLDLAERRRKVTRVSYTLDLHGVKVTRSARVTMVLIDNDRVVVSNTDPLIVGVSDFNLYDGVRKLEQAANVDVSPLAIVSFNLTFDRNTAPTAPASGTGEVTAAAPQMGPILAWNVTTPDIQSCSARVLQLARRDGIYFETLSARIKSDSIPLLQAFADVLSRCPMISVQFSGLTGPGESSATALASQRAEAVSRYLWSRGVQRSRMLTSRGDPISAASQRAGRVDITIAD